jgi:acetoacetyl-CoA synthetase
MSGGTDVATGFVGGAPTVPVWPGLISVRCLGVAAEAWDDDGLTVVDKVGELVVRRPMPSMPVRLWGDTDGSRYREAYFDAFPGVWRQGDWVSMSACGTVVIHGRSDSTLNRNGVRTGSADIYGAVESIPEVAEALVVGVERPDGGYWMPLFVVVAEGSELDDRLRSRIRRTIRDNVSPRHVPDDIVAVPAIPHTRTGKKLEVPVKRILLGVPREQGARRDALAGPGALVAVVEYADSRAPAA